MARKNTAWMAVMNTVQYKYGMDVFYTLSIIASNNPTALNRISPFIIRMVSTMSLVSAIFDSS